MTKLMRILYAAFERASATTRRNNIVHFWLAVAAIVFTGFLLWKINLDVVEMPDFYLVLLGLIGLIISFRFPKIRVWATGLVGLGGLCLMARFFGSDFFEPLNLWIPVCGAAGAVLLYRYPVARIVGLTLLGIGGCNAFAPIPVGNALTSRGVLHGDCCRGNSCLVVSI